MKQISMFLAIVMASLPGVGWTTSPAGRSLDALFKSAKTVVTGKVTSMRASCGQSEKVCNSSYAFSLEAKQSENLNRRASKVPNTTPFAPMFLWRSVLHTLCFGGADRIQCAGLGRL